MQEVHKKDSRKPISTNPERQIFNIFSSMPSTVASQVDTKLNKLLANQKKSWTWHCQIKNSVSLNQITLRVILVFILMFSDDSNNSYIKY